MTATSNQDRTPSAVKAVLDKPGRYTLQGMGMIWLFEVDDRKRIHRLNPRTMARDVILSKEGWAESAKEGKVTAYIG